MEPTETKGHKNQMAEPRGATFACRFKAQGALSTTIRKKEKPGWGPWQLTQLIAADRTQRYKNQEFNASLAKLRFEPSLGYMKYTLQVNNKKLN